MTRSFLFAAVLLTAATTAFAFDDQDRQAIEIAVATFEDSFDARDWEAILPPPRIFEVMSELTGQSEGAIRKAALSSIADVMERADIKSYDIQLGFMQSGTSAAGADYAFLPTLMEVSLDGGPVQSITSTVMAAELETGWHLFRLDNWQHWMLFLRAYPEFEGVSPPE